MKKGRMPTIADATYLADPTIVFGNGEIFGE
jgi:hypothetical protein